MGDRPGSWSRCARVRTKCTGKNSVGLWSQSNPRELLGIIGPATGWLGCYTAPRGPSLEQRLRYTMLVCEILPSSQDLPPPILCSPAPTTARVLAPVKPGRRWCGSAVVPTAALHPDLLTGRCRCSLFSAFKHRCSSDWPMGDTLGNRSGRALVAFFNLDLIKFSV
jgi:hypothetical protein